MGYLQVAVDFPFVFVVDIVQTTHLQIHFAVCIPIIAPFAGGVGGAGVFDVVGIAVGRQAEAVGEAQPEQSSLVSVAKAVTGFGVEYPSYLVFFFQHYVHNQIFVVFVT